jgi:hypothetical protein
MRIHHKEVAGISAYRTVGFQQGGTSFTMELPSNWLLDEYHLSNARGTRYALHGPTNEVQRRQTTLDITLREKDDSPQYESLKAFFAYTIKHKRIGKTSLLFERDIIVSGQESREAKISSIRPAPDKGRTVQSAIVIQWVCLILEGLFLEVSYQSPSEDFDTYFEVYQKAIDSLCFPSK